ncbi:hypothetical protein [Acidisoma sp. S159]|uniref:hypothetical protein n=1 Tax=Acidisoma sp. S159 TaxID=1747225 RepID=UPI00131D4B67|nr:hypothetical protein [Acidisoma sp. S159]
MQIENEMDRLSEAAGDGIPGSPELATSVRFDQQVRDRRNELISSIYATSVTTLERLAAKAAVALRLVRTTLAISQHTSIRLVTRSRPAWEGRRMSARMREKTKVARHPFSDLSFVRDNPGRCNGRDFWTSVPSDDYDADCLLGQALGQEYVACSRQHEDYGQPTLPRHIVKRMIERGDFSGLHIGFFGAIASAAMRP